VGTRRGIEFRNERESDRTYGDLGPKEKRRTALLKRIHEGTKAFSMVGRQNSKKRRRKETNIRKQQNSCGTCRLWTTKEVGI